MYFNFLLSEITYLCHIQILMGNLVCKMSYLCAQLEISPQGKVHKYSYYHNDKENMIISPVGSHCDWVTVTESVVWANDEPVSLFPTSTLPMVTNPWVVGCTTKSFPCCPSKIPRIKPCSLITTSPWCQLSSLWSPSNQWCQFLANTLWLQPNITSQTSLCLHSSPSSHSPSSHSLTSPFSHSHLCTLSSPCCQSHLYLRCSPYSPFPPCFLTCHWKLGQQQTRPSGRKWWVTPEDTTISEKMIFGMEYIL